MNRHILINFCLYLVLLFVALHCTHAQTSPDPTCETGIISQDVCCPARCERCGGPDCRGLGPNAECCRRRARIRAISCADSGPPCLIPPPTTPPPTTQSVPTPVPPTPVPPTPVPPTPVAPTPLEATPRTVSVFVPGSIWSTVTDISGSPVPREEGCFLMVNGRGYLLGGRGRPRPSIYDPRTRTWTRGRVPPLEVHHIQCVAFGDNVYMVNGWFGNFPFEENHESVIVYDTVNDSWGTLPGLPEPRRRGGSASVIFDNKIWTAGGNRGGHGDHATTLGYLDVFDIFTGEWSTESLPDLPEPRDHVGGAVVNGDKFCVAGGRDGGSSRFFEQTILSTYCYEFATNTWINMNAELPAGRAGAATETTCDGHLMIAGGESGMRPAHDNVDVFDGVSWTSVDSLNQGRHGTGLAVSDCSCGQIFIAAGVGRRGGGPRLTSVEVYLPGGSNVVCDTF